MTYFSEVICNLVFALIGQYLSCPCTGGTSSRIKQGLYICVILGIFVLNVLLLIVAVEKECGM